MRYKQLFAHGLLIAVLCAPPSLRAQDAIADAARRAASARLKPGDHIELQFRLDPSLNGSIVVDPFGHAVFPRLGSLDVAQITIGALPDTLRNRFSEYLRNPEMDVSVLRRVTVNGEVRQPNVYMLDVTSTVRDAIAHAGGLLETANRHNVYIVRGSQRLKVPNWEHSTGTDVDLLSGDQLIVGRQSWLVLNALPVISTSVIVVGLIRSLRH